MKGPTMKGPVMRGRSMRSMAAAGRASTTLATDPAKVLKNTAGGAAGAPGAARQCPREARRQP